MTDTEASRLDLYHRLQEVLGTGPATTLMSHLPPIASADLITKGEFSDFKIEMHEFKAEVAARFERVDAKFDEVNKRIDRVLLAVVAGQVALFAAIFGAAALF